jgi:hypothetical protein
MEQIAIKQLQIMHDRTGHILAAVHDGPLTAGMPAVGIVPARGQTLVAIEVPAAHQGLSMGQLLSRLQLRAGRVIVNDRPIGCRSKKAAKSGGKSKLRRRKK